MAQWAMTVPLAAVTVIAQKRGIRAREGVDPKTYRQWLRIALGAMAVVILTQYALRG